MYLKDFHISRKNIPILIGIYILLGFLIYGLSLGNGFIDYDDPRFIIDNQLIKSFSLSTLKTIFSTYESVLYVPLLFLSYQIDFFIGGLNPFIFHLHSLLIHIANALLVTVLISILSHRKDVIAVLCGILFLVHPLNTEAIAWASTRKISLRRSFLFCASLHIFGIPERTYDVGIT